MSNWNIRSDIEIKTNIYFDFLPADYLRYLLEKNLKNNFLFETHVSVKISTHHRDNINGESRFSCLISVISYPPFC